ncbi:hypothetical protein SRB17_49360 [Streptomyces sp. RB17]|nr:hypothetical protein [Streptomyces sp. RB17]
MVGPPAEHYGAGLRRGDLVVAGAVHAGLPLRPGSSIAESSARLPPVSVLAAHRKLPADSELAQTIAALARAQPEAPTERRTVLSAASAPDVGTAVVGRLLRECAGRYPTGRPRACPRHAGVPEPGTVPGPGRSICRPGWAAYAHGPERSWSLRAHHRRARMACTQSAHRGDQPPAATVVVRVMVQLAAWLDPPLTPRLRRQLRGIGATACSADSTTALANHVHCSEAIAFPAQQTRNARRPLASSCASDVSIPGIGVRNAAVLLTNAGDGSSFRSAAHLAPYPHVVRCRVPTLPLALPGAGRRQHMDSRGQTGQEPEHRPGEVTLPGSRSTPPTRSRLCQVGSTRQSRIASWQTPQQPCIERELMPRHLDFGRRGSGGSSSTRL